MKIDLCKLFGVEEGEEFKIEYEDYTSDRVHKIDNNIFYVLCEGKFLKDNISVETIKRITKIIKLPKKKSFSRETLNFFKCIDKKWEWIAKDEDDKVCMFTKKPEKGYRANEYGIWEIEGFNNWMELVDFNQYLFNEMIDICCAPGSVHIKHFL